MCLTKFSLIKTGNYVVLVIFYKKVRIKIKGITDAII